MRTKQEQARDRHKRNSVARNAGNRGPELSAHSLLVTVHPKAVKLFERHWVNLILWGNYERLRDATLAEMEEPCSADARCSGVCLW